jgi:folylpolyglutamate synthase
VPVNPELKGVKLGLAGAHQATNASLAVQLCNAFFKAQPTPRSSTSSPPSIDAQADTATLSDGFLEGLKEAHWPGRCQTVRDSQHRSSFWYLDGAHTVESLTCCGEWFVAPGLGIKE